MLALSFTGVVVDFWLLKCNINYQQLLFNVVLKIKYLQWMLIQNLTCNVSIKRSRPPSFRNTWQVGGDSSEIFRKFFFIKNNQTTEWILHIKMDQIFNWPGFILKHLYLKEDGQLFYFGKCFIKFQGTGCWKISDKIIIQNRHPLMNMLL